MARNYIPTIAETYAATPSVNALIDSYGYGSLVGEIIAEIDIAAELLSDLDPEFGSVVGEIIA
jgi:hypothetical protein